MKSHHSGQTFDPASRPSGAEDETEHAPRRGMFGRRSAERKLREGRQNSLLSLVSGIDSRRTSSDERAQARQEEQDAERQRKQQAQQTSVAEGLKEELVLRQHKYVAKIAKMVENLIEKSEVEASERAPLTGPNLESACSGKRIPKIGVNAYLQRLVKYVNVWMDEDQGPESSGVRTLLVALIYVDRALNTDTSFVLSHGTMHRVFMGAMLVAVKFFEDEPISNRFWAQVGGVNLTEVNQIEAKICTTLNFDLNISRSLLEAYANSVN